MVGEKRLAIHVEDHPAEYANFEGVIPAGDYGAGKVLIWDRGRWTPQGDPTAGYSSGYLSFRLKGKKLKGGWYLVRMRPKPREKRKAWLLIKADDEAARTAREPDILKQKPKSIVPGRAIENIGLKRKLSKPRRKIARKRTRRRKNR